MKRKHRMYFGFIELERYIRWIWHPQWGRVWTSSPDPYEWWLDI